MDKGILFTASLFLYGLFFLGIGMLYDPLIKEIKMKYKMRHRLQARKKEMEGPSKVLADLDYMANVAFQGKISGKTFLIITAFLILLVGTAGMKNFQPMKGILVAVVSGAIPFIILKIKIETIRRKSSFEGEVLIGNFISQYRISRFNIYQTIEEVVENHKETKVTNRLMMKLLLELRGTGNPGEIEKACDRFAHAVNTSWGKMLAYNIGLAAESGINVSSAVEDILIQLREARTLVEERKRLNAEAARMVVYLVPLLYFATILMSLQVIGMSLKEFFMNQFFSDQGFTLFLAILFMLLMNIVLIETVNNQRFDY